MAMATTAGRDHPGDDRDDDLAWGHPDCLVDAEVVNALSGEHDHGAEHSERGDDRNQDCQASHERLAGQYRPILRRSRADDELEHLGVQPDREHRCGKSGCDDGSGGQ
jgi:hypothetical protein